MILKKINTVLAAALSLLLAGCAGTASNGTKIIHENVDVTHEWDNDTGAETYQDFGYETESTQNFTDTQPVNNETMGVTADMDASDGMTVQGVSVDDGADAGTEAAYTAQYDDYGADNAGAADTAVSYDAPSGDAAAPGTTSVETTVITLTMPSMPSLSDDGETEAQTADTTGTDVTDGDISDADLPYDGGQVTESIIVPETDIVTVPSYDGDESDRYDPKFYTQDLFIGDSISTGLSLYNFLPSKNVFAKVGLNPTSALTKSVETPYGEINITQMVQNVRPKRVYIMLGSNGIQWLSDKEMINSLGKLTDLILEQESEAEIIIVSVPPVTMEYSFKGQLSSYDIMNRIDSYNQSLRGFCKANGFVYSDVYSKLIDGNGYFSSEYAEKDGLHFKPAAYHIMLRQVQDDTEKYEENKEKEKKPEDVTVQTEASSDIVTDSADNKDAGAVQAEETVVSETVTVGTTAETTAETVAETTVQTTAAATVTTTVTTTETTADTAAAAETTASAVTTTAVQETAESETSEETTTTGFIPAIWRKNV